MINTECGTKIPARVKDIVRNRFGWIGEVYQINDNDEFYMISGQCDDHHIWTFEDCTLMHRGFEVGDPVEVTIPGGDRWLDETYELGLENRFLVRHKDEAWRDHSEYKK